MYLTADDLVTVTAFAERSSGALLAELRTAGEVIELDGGSVVDKASLMARIGADVPVPDNATPTGWDVLSDALWSALATYESDSVFFVWHRADVMMTGALNDFLIGLTVLINLSRSVETTETGFPRPMSFRIVLLGESPAFGPFPG